MANATSKKRSTSNTDSSGRTVDENVPNVPSGPGVSGGNAGKVGGPPNKPIQGSVPKDWLPPAFAKPMERGIPGVGVKKPPSNTPAPGPRETNLTPAPVSKPKFLGPPVKAPSPSVSQLTQTPNRPGFLGPPVKVPPPNVGSPKPPGNIGSPKPPGNIGSPPPSNIGSPKPPSNVGSLAKTASRAPKYSQAGTVKWRY